MDPNKQSRRRGNTLHEGHQLFQDGRAEPSQCDCVPIGGRPNLSKQYLYSEESAHPRTHQADPGHDIAAPMGKYVCLGDWTLPSRKRG